MKQGRLPNSTADPQIATSQTEGDQQVSYIAFCNKETTQLSLNTIQLPSWKKPWIDPALKSALFPIVTDKDETQRLNTYLLLDAAQVTALEGIFSLEKAEELGVKPLLSGAPQKELKNYAPYLINLTLSKEQIESDEVSSFHKDIFERYWGKNCGIFLHSYADLDTLARHCKKFIKLKDDNDRWYFFRFYDPRVAQDYFKWMAGDKSRVAKWFGINHGEALIQSIIIEAKQGGEFISFLPQHCTQLNQQAPIQLSAIELNWMQQSRWIATKNAIYQELNLELSAEPYALTELNRDLIETWCEEALTLGYTTERAVYDFAFSHILAHHFDLNLSEVDQYLAAKEDADLEKAKELHQILLNAINTYRMNEKEK